jgi:predicted ATPase
MNFDSASRKSVAQKLQAGLDALGAGSRRNLGLLLHLLGLTPPEGSLAGLDGVLIGLRTRELLQLLLEKRCSLSPVALLIEDLHWTDSASAELVEKIINSAVKLRLLVLTTRRPDYTPPWLGNPLVTTVSLGPLATNEIRQLVKERLGVDALPEGLARQVIDKSDGNPFFAEEIVTYLTERGTIRTVAGELNYDANATSAALPASVQNLLAVRVDRLDPKDRTILQAASVIGRRFDAGLLASVLNESETEKSLRLMHSLELVDQRDRVEDFEFRHALVRDALYNSLLSEPRAAFHLKIAGEIERRNDNRLSEVAEALAHHYSQTGNLSKSFIYLTMAGSKSLGVYSLDEAGAHFNAALAVLDKNHDCASADQTIEFFVGYMLFLNLTAQWNFLIDVLERYQSRLNRMRDDWFLFDITMYWR